MFWMHSINAVSKQEVKEMVSVMGEELFRTIFLTPELCTHIKNLRSYSSIVQDADQFPGTNIDSYKDLILHINHELSEKFFLKSDEINAINSFLIPLTNYLGNHSLQAYLPMVNMNAKAARELAQKYFRKKMGVLSSP